MDSNLPESLKLMFGHEGGYSSAKTDSGNYLNEKLVGTKYGVTGKTLAAHRGLKTLSAADVKALTLKEAEEIYRKSYWSQSGGSLLPVGVDYMAFDYGVNSGPSRAVKSLQRVIGVGQDGIVGVQTINAVNEYKGGIEKLLRDYADERMRFLRSLGGAQGWSANGRGWTIRVTGKDPNKQWKDQPGVIGNALAMVRKKPVESTKEIPAGVPDGSAKADPKNIGIAEIVKNPEAWAPLGGLLSALGSVFSGSGPLQYALAAGVVVGIGVGVYYFVKRVRADG